MNNQWFSKLAVWMVIALVLFTVFKQFDGRSVTGSRVGYSEFLEEVRGKRIKSVTLQEGMGLGCLHQGNARPRARAMFNQAFEFGNARLAGGTSSLDQIHD
ncbi:MAG: ATP-dependent metallopeptidase FtsH/Yme1/Tma family protein, partial [Dechloromonas sp.]|nr:ATP-dependent metallopeptidase FtsH/Yme1/Tma family protein [Dechloromonas sp.]